MTTLGANGIAALALALVFGAVSWGMPREAAQECALQVVTPEEIREAMRRHGDYDVTATTNAPRFGAEVVLQLARWAQARNPDGGPLFIRQDDWFDAYLDVAGVSADQAPIGVRMAHRHKQDMQIEYRSDRVLAPGQGETRPRTALAIKVSWPDTPGSPDKYSYKDTLSIPAMKVAFERVITYRLLDFGDMIVYDEMTGVSGRPTSGVLGLLFSVIGNARILESRFAVSDDGLQVVRVRGKKWAFPKTATATLQPDGHGESGVPEHRPDLKAIETRLETPLQVDYVTFSC